MQLRSKHQLQLQLRMFREFNQLRNLPLNQKQHQLLL